MRLNISEAIIKLMHESSYKNLSLDELTKIFGKNKIEQNEVKKIISDFYQQGLVIKDRNHKFGLAEKNGYLRGIISVSGKGYGFISREEGDVFISPVDTNYSMDGDEVLYKITKEAHYDLKAEGYVQSILHRNTDIIVGRFVKNKYFGFVVPEDKRLQYDLYIPKKFSNQAKHGDIVSCKILKYPSRGKKPEGMILSVIGKDKNLSVDIQSELIRRKIPEDFPLKVKKQVQRISSESVQKEIQRRNVVDKMIFTIDGAYSKDLDDAISVVKTQSGNYELGVYIADVSHFVFENSPIDKEALARGTSIYFADRVIPMLPEKLSNDLCSLNPHEDKLVLALTLFFDKNGKLSDHRIEEAVIASRYRLVYDDVSDYLEKNSGPLLELRDEQLFTALKNAQELSSLLRSRRAKRGSIDFDFPETQFQLQGEKVISVNERKTRSADKLIEDFMIAANEAIAETFYIQEIPFLYRVHESPNPEKLDAVFQILNTLNIKPKFHKDGKIYPKDIQDIMSQIKDLPEKDMISYSLLRSMQKAKYSHVNAEHFGLSSKYYTHFTSPIRRYPDLQIHRIIKETINGRMDIQKIAHYENILPDIADQTSSSEMKAVDLERTVDDILACYYMKNHIGEVFEGKIVNFTSFGMFILLDNSIEGLIRYTDMDEYSRFTKLPIEEFMRSQYHIGDRLKVRVEKVDFIFREVILSLEELYIEG